MTPDQIRREAEIIVVTSGGRLSIEAAMQAIEEDEALSRAKEGAGYCTCSDAPILQSAPESIWCRLMAWLSCSRA